MSTLPDKADTLPATGQMTKAEAEKLTARISRDGFALGELLLLAHDGKAWAAMGYRSWSAYIASEFTFSRATSYRLLAAEREPNMLVEGSECLTSETDPPVAETTKGEAETTPIKPDRVITDPPKAEKPKPPPAPEEPRNETGKVPTLREEAHDVFSTLLEATEGIGAKWTVEEATAWENRSRREMATWRKASGIQAELKPERRQGTISRPEDRANGHKSAHKSVSPPAQISAKRHADDCRCYGCQPAKVKG